ncbi:MAG: hypothetical protein IH945_00670 [Armatimonadetes bacterium]|nr:hypothetical protein [Armatimonadota bacterium]
MTSCKSGLAKTAGMAWILVALVCLVFAAAAFGQNKGKGGGKGGGGGGGGGCGDGTLYYRDGGQYWSMDCDGANKTALHPNASGDPSRKLHSAGDRWFLRASNGDLFAVSDLDGFEVQLTDASSGVAAGSAVRWSKDDPATSAVDEADTFIAFVGTDVSGVEGIYTAAVEFDADGLPLPVVAVDLALEAAVVSFDLSPDAGAIAYISTSGELIVAVSGGGSSLLATVNSTAPPSWSPDGSRIAFTNDGVYAVDPDGSNLTLLARNKPSASAFRPDWSPTGSHLMHGYFDRFGSDTILGSLDIYRVTSKGKGKTNLTEDTTQLLNPVGWR